MSTKRRRTCKKWLPSVLSDQYPPKKENIKYMSGVNKIRGYGQMIKDLALSSTRVVEQWCNFAERRPNASAIRKEEEKLSNVFFLIFLSLV